MEEIIEGFNQFIDELREDKQIHAKGHVVVSSTSGEPGFGGFCDVSLEVWYVSGKGEPPIKLTTLTTRARPKTDDFKRELFVRLMKYLLHLAATPQFTCILYGDPI